MTTTPNPRIRKRRAIQLRLLGAVVAIGALMFVLPGNVVWEMLHRLPGSAWLFGVVAIVVIHAGGILKWRILVNAAGASLGVVPASQCYYYGIFGNTFLPSVVGGDAVRISLGLQHVRSRTALVIGTVVDRMIDLAGLGVLTIVGLALVPNPADVPLWQGLAGVMAVATVGAGVLFAGSFMIRRKKLSVRFRRRIVNVRRSWNSLKRNWLASTLTLLISISLQASLILLNAWLGAWCGVKCSLAVWLVVWPLAKLAALAPITQGGIGVREAALTALFVPFGVIATAAAAAGLAYQSASLLAGLVAGVIAWGIGRLTRQFPSAARAAT